MEPRPVRLTNPEVFRSTGDDRRFLTTYAARVIRSIWCRRVGELQAPSVTVIRAATQDEPLQHRLVYHSPDGFEWGYGGSGPSELALNILALFVPAPEAWRLHHPFKDQFVATLPHPGGTILGSQIVDWIQKQWAEGRPA